MEGMERLRVFRGKRVLVTGSTGFKGSWLSCWMNHLGAKVYGYALPPGEEDLFRVAHLEDVITTQIYGDIRDYDSLASAFRVIEPEFVFHLAAQALVRRSYDEPKLTVDTNVGGSLNVLEAVRNTSSVRALVYITSDKCYLNNEWIWGYRENDILGGRDPYSASKAAAENIFAAYSTSFFNDRKGFGAASARAGNVIGGGDWGKDRIIPDCIRALRDGVPIRIRQPAATRPWQHVLEPIYGYMILAASLAEDPEQFRGSYNFGPNISSNAKTVLDLVNEVVQTWGSGKIELDKSFVKRTGHDEAGLLYLNSDKAWQKLGWRTKMGFKETVDNTVRWYRQYIDGVLPINITLSQINDYKRYFI